MKNEILNLILNFYKFTKEGYSLTSKKCNYKKNEINNIIYAGMGGSAIAGDIIKEILADTLRVPFEIIRNYSLPAYVNRNSLVIISSFSGNTEETLSCYKDAIKRKCKIIAISSNGKIEKIAKKYNHDFIKIEKQMPPRAALGLTLFALLKKLSIFYMQNKKLTKDIRIFVKNAENKKTTFLKAKQLAKKMQNKIVLLYSDSVYQSIPRRAANQLSENSKHFAHFNYFPEMNHNEIVGLKYPKYIIKNSIIIYIKYTNQNKKISKRMDIVSKILKNAGFSIENILFNKKNHLENIIDSIVFFDLVSYFLSEINKEDAIAIKRIELLKEKMKK